MIASESLGTLGRKTVALVTGANKGIGKETARQLAERGITVLLGARDESRGKAAAQEISAAGDVRFVQLDVTNDDQIDAVARLIEDEFGHLDILINNEGVIAERNTTAASATVDEVQATYETNVFGVVRVTNALIPVLRRSGNGRIVNLSSFLGSLGISSASEPTSGVPVLIGYFSSKTAVNALTVHYANELREHAIKVNSADPGYVSTDLNGHTGSRSVEQGAAVVVSLAVLGEDGPTGGFFGEDGIQPW